MIPYDVRCLTEITVLTQRWLVSQLKFKKLANKSPLFWAVLIGLGSVFSFFYVRCEETRVEVPEKIGRLFEKSSDKLS